MAGAVHSNKKLCFIAMLGLAILTGVSLVILRYVQMNRKDQEPQLFTNPPSWYTAVLGTSGATTGKKIELKRFRTYNRSVEPKARPDNLQTEVFRTQKCAKISKWAVITTIAPETTETMTILLERSPDFCLLVVGDRKSPDKYSISKHQDRFIYLSIEDQLKLTLEIVPLTPENSFSRKNIGFMYAIANKAQVILDMDDDNVPIIVNGKWLPLIESLGTFPSPIVDTKREGSVWNPYPHFGAADAWPRGFPLDKIAPFDRQQKIQTVKCLPIVQQYMANRDPDMDAIYRLTHPLPMDYDSSKKSMVLPHGVFCPYNAQATVHLNQAFWSMLLPKTVGGRVSDIWRSYISEYVILYMNDMCVMFSPPAVRHDRNSHDYMCDFYSELPLYMLTPSLVDTLLSHPPLEGKGLAEVLRDTYMLLYEMGVLEADDIDYVLAWINDLIRVGYSFPTL